MPRHPNAARKPQPARPARPVAKESVSAPPTPISGPLLVYLQDPPTVRHQLAMSLGGPLAGHTTFEKWLPEGLSPAIDELREEHRQRRDQVVNAILTVRDLHAGFDREDKEHAEALRAAYRVAGKTPADTRTSEAARATLIAAAEEAKWCALDVLEETIVKAIDVIRRDEDQLLGGLKRRLAVSDEERLAAMRKVDEARVAAWQAMQLGQWVLGSADAKTVFANQPAPVPSAPPAQFSEDLASTAFERHWTNPKPARTFVSELVDPSTETPSPRDLMPDVTEMVDDPDEVNMLISSREGAAA